MPEEYSLEISPAAKRDLKRLPVSIQKEIVFSHLPAIKNAPFSTSSPLVGALKRERSYHFGRKPEYRIVFYIRRGRNHCDDYWESGEYLQTSRKKKKKTIENGLCIFAVWRSWVETGTLL